MTIIDFIVLYIVLFVVVYFGHSLFESFFGTLAYWIMCLIERVKNNEKSKYD